MSQTLIHNHIDYFSFSPLPFPSAIYVLNFSFPICIYTSTRIIDLYPHKKIKTINYSINNVYVHVPLP